MRMFVCIVFYLVRAIFAGFIVRFASSIKMCYCCGEICARARATKVVRETEKFESYFKIVQDCATWKVASIIYIVKLQVKYRENRRR